MCYVVGSIEQATGTCRMCKVFKPSTGRCPHATTVCRNRQMHPHHDVLHLKNAEVQTFNGCGFCKWARTNPPSRAASYQNSGWPGCCRPPSPGEQKLIQAADWPAVSIVHHIPIPSDIKTILDSLTIAPRNATFAHNSTNTRCVIPVSQPPTMSRRTSAVAVNALRGDATPVKASSLAIPGKLRSGGSPQQVASPLSNTPTRSATGEGSPSSVASSNGIDHIVLPRRSAVDTSGEKRRDNSRESKQSPGRKHAELTGSLSRKGSSHRPSVSAVAAPVYTQKVNVEAQLQPRRGSSANPSAPSSNPLPVPRSIARDTERPNQASSTRQRSSLELDVSGMSISSGSSASSSDSGDGSETTVISDGGFTDYLSDESEAELQKQAEMKAAIIAQTLMEEQEFRAARQQLANIDLRPPKSWTSNVNSTPRSQSNSSSGSNGPSYSPQAFASAS